MAKPILTVGTTDPEAFSKLSGEEQRWLRKRRLWQAEWTTKELPTGDVIFRLRARAKESQNRATVFLVALIISVLLGLVWFVGLPLWQDYLRGLQDAEAVRAEADLTAREVALQKRIGGLRESVSYELPNVWLEQTTANTNVLREVAVIDAQNGWAVGNDGTVMNTVNGGASWQKIDTGNNKVFSAAAFSGTDAGWIVGEDGTILHTADGGATWIEQESGVNGFLIRVYFRNPLTGWIVGGDGTILKTTNGGVSWDTYRTGSEEALIGVTFIDDQNGLVVGEKGTILKTSNAGKTWSEIDNPAMQENFLADLSSIDFVDELRGWAVGNYSTILSTQDGGASWSRYEKQRILNAELGDTQLEPYSFWDVSFADANRGWIVGTNGIVLTTGDGGETWQPQTSGTDKTLTALGLADRRSVWVVGDGIILGSSRVLEDAIRQTTDAIQFQQALSFANGQHGVDLSDELTEIANLIVQENALTAERNRLRPVGTVASDQEAALRMAVALAERTAPEDLEETLQLLAAARSLQ